MHGTLMVFFVLTIAPQSGFANLVLPQQIGARRMAFPWHQRARLLDRRARSWSFCSPAFLLPAGGPHRRMDQLPAAQRRPRRRSGPGRGMDCWLISIGLFCIGSWFSAVNMLVTILGERARGMTLVRMP